MHVNIFEGARRISLLLAALATILTIIEVVTARPQVSVAYIVTRPDGPFVKAAEPCPDKSAHHYFTASTYGGRELPVTLCLATMRFPDGQDLIPYMIDDKGMFWGAREFSSQVLAYERELQARFRFSVEDEKEYDRQETRARWKNARSAAKYLFIGLLIWVAVVKIVGWIVRGFLGIPNGMDRRPEEPSA